MMLARLIGGFYTQAEAVAEALLSDTGDVTTLMGDPPKIMIGSTGGIDFTQFLLHMGPIVLVAWLINLALLLFLFRRELAQPFEAVGFEQNQRGQRSVCTVEGAVFHRLARFFILHSSSLSPVSRNCRRTNKVVEKHSGECETRQNLEKKRSLHAVNEHCEPQLTLDCAS